MATARDLITASLRLIGAIAPGESISAAEASDGLASLNRLLDSWSNDSLAAYISPIEEFALTPGVSSYTIGSGGAFNTQRPTKYNQATLKISNSGQPVEYPMQQATLTEWSSIKQKTLQSNIPNTFYVDVGYPLDTLLIYPVPSQPSSLVLYTQKLLTTLATLDESVVFPPGYERALVYNFAMEIAPEYGKQPSELILNAAIESKAAFKRNNHRELHLRVDAALTPGPIYNIYTGDS